MASASLCIPTKRLRTKDLHAKLNEVVLQVIPPFPVLVQASCVPLYTVLELHNPLADLDDLGDAPAVPRERRSTPLLAQRRAEHAGRRGDRLEKRHVSGPRMHQLAEKRIVRLREAHLQLAVDGAACFIDTLWSRVSRRSLYRR